MKTKSFTLIELLVVIVIIGILAGVIVVSTSSAINKANFAKAQAFSSTVKNELFSDLVSEWTFDEGGAQDTWGNNDGTVTGATYQTKSSGNCVYGGCYSFNGTTDYIDVGANSNLSRDKITISAWIKTNGSSNEQAIVFDTHVGGTIPIEFYINSNRYIVFNSYNNGLVARVTSNGKVSLNTWTHIVASFDKDLSTKTNKVYINGVLDNTSDVQTILPIRNGTLRIGSYGVNWKFNGLIDDVRIYNAALTTAQIKQQYIAGIEALFSKNIISEKEYKERIDGLAEK